MANTPETYTVETLMVEYNKKAGRLSFSTEVISDDEDMNGVAADFSINFRSYDENAPEGERFVEDEEAFEEGLGKLKALAATLCDEEGQLLGGDENEPVFAELISAIESGNAAEIEEKAWGFTSDAYYFQLYVSSEQQRASLEPIVEFIQPDKIDDALAYELTEGSLAGQSFQSIGGFHRNNFLSTLNVFVAVPVVDEETGEEKVKKIRVSQLIRPALSPEQPKKLVSLKFAKVHTEARNRVANAEDGNFREGGRQKAIDMYNRRIERAYQEKVEEMSEIFGWDVASMVDNDEAVIEGLTLEIESYNFEGKEGFWAKAKVSKDALGDIA